MKAAGLAAALIAALAAPPASGEVRVRLVETDPPAPAVLARGQPFFARVQYEDADAVQLWVRPYLGGKEQNAWTHPAGMLRGSGEFLGWFHSGGTLRVDEVRVIARRGANTWVAATLPVQLEWTGAPRGPLAPPPWAVELLRSQNLSVAAFDAQIAENLGAEAGFAAFTWLFGVLVALVCAGALAAPLWALWRWRGRWRAAAVLPLAWMAFVALRIVFGVVRDPTSHSLWPLELLMWGAGSTVFIGALAAARALRARAGL